MFCSNCGQTLQHNAKFCTKCGANVTAPVKADKPAAPAAATAATPSSSTVATEPEGAYAAARVIDKVSSQEEIESWYSKAGWHQWVPIVGAIISLFIPHYTAVILSVGMAGCAGTAYDKCKSKVLLAGIIISIVSTICNVVARFM
ncbi:hypothetical protein AGMMS49992_13570 [Clostridia bacterium]|nr:hypothetical protein AGMMS49992_13570 [Clostridia bacterium]